MENKNRELTISTAPSKTSAHWINAYTTIQELTAKAYDPIVVNLTKAEYSALPKGEKDRKKDVGGFVGGHLRGARRRKGHVLNRSFITLDIDDLPADVDFPAHLHTMDFGWLAHTTLSHTPEAQRWRLWVWLARDVNPDEYTAVARRVAQDIRPGLDWFDPTTFEPERLMFNPSTLEDGDYEAHVSKIKDDLNPDLVLNRYTDWREITTWPGITPEDARRHTHAGTKVEDPRTKPGIIGAFNRAWPIEAAITHFLPDVYQPGTMKGRWTYQHGSSSNGLIIYDGGLHAYSQHATDPASEQMVNAFDLVRIHLYGDQDTDAKPGTPSNKLPSYTAMTDMALAEPATKREANTQAVEKMKEVFQPVPPATELPEPHQVTATIDGETITGELVDNPLAWLDRMETKRNGVYDDTIGNFALIFTHDPRYNHISWNAHSEQLEVQDPQKLPWETLKPGWTDNDTAQLKTHLADHYGGLYHPGKMQDALLSCATKRAFHPVRDYFTTLPPWDGIPRVDTLLVDTLGADDTPYTRAVTRKTLVAAVRRTYHPGTKFDNVLILVGPQGVGKSTIFARLAGQWFSDSLSITDMKDKTGAEKLAGILIMEIAELAGMRKMDAETLKSFISRADDKYRPAYAKTVESHPRQGIIVGSTNASDGFLRDPTGGRRFWAVNITGHGTRKVWDLTDYDVNQIWAEALHFEKAGEKLYLEGDVAAAAIEHQAAAIETDDRTGIVADYLEQKLPAAWNTLPVAARRHYLTTGTFPDGTALQPGVWDSFTPRYTVSKIEIWSECFGREPEDMKRADSYEIASIMSQIDGWEDAGESRRLEHYGKQRVYRRKRTAAEDDRAA